MTTVASAAEFRLQLPAEAARGRLVVSGHNTDVVIEGVSGNELVAVSPGEAPDVVEDQPAGAEREGLRSLLDTGSDNTGLGLQISVDGSEVKVIPVRSRSPEKLFLRIPRAMGVRLMSAFNSDVEVRNIDGEIELTVTEGDMQLADISGPVVLQAVNGTVTVAYASFPTTRPSSINAVNGSVTVELPPDTKADLDLRTINGDIFTDLPVEVKNRQVVAWGGPKSVRAVMNGGGMALKVNSINDDVIVRGRQPK